MAVFRRVGVALALLAIAVAVGAAACAGEGRGSPASDTRAGDLPWIVATTDIVGHVVAQVGGDAIDEKTAVRKSLRTGSRVNS